MLHINAVELYKEPRERIKNIFSKLPGEPEMTEDESAFLCGLLKKFRPKKIVEVGIAGGGTSAIILSCMKCLDMYDSYLFSVDYSKHFYRDGNYVSGHLGIEAAKQLDLENNHITLLGNIACSFDEIKKEIDFLIIDTMHITPGELLDYITLLPYLKQDALVVFHDIALPYAVTNHREAFVMGMLFACSEGEKYFNTFDFGGIYSNIGALQVTGKTMEDIEKVFLALLVPWEYIPDKRQLAGYRSIINDCYSKTLLSMFDKAVEINTKHPKNEKRMLWLFPFDLIKPGSSVVLFCAGDVCKDFMKQLAHTNYCELVAVFDNDVTRQGDSVWSPSKLMDVLFEYIVVATINENAAKEIIAQLEDMGIDKEIIIWRSYNVDM